MQNKQDVIDSLKAALADEVFFSEEHDGKKPARASQNQPARKSDPGEREWEARRKEQRENARLRSREVDARGPVFNWLSPAANLEGFKGRFSA